MDLTANLTLGAFWLGFLRGLMIFIFLFVSVLLIGVVLIQKGRGGGLSSAFGAAMSSSVFGTKTGDVFTWITVVLAVIFLLSSLFLTVLVKPESAETGYKDTKTPAGAGQQPGATPPGLTVTPQTPGSQPGSGTPPSPGPTPGPTPGPSTPPGPGTPPTQPR
jgi:preprotein translocase subunit SecG